MSLFTDKVLQSGKKKKWEAGSYTVTSSRTLIAGDKPGTGIDIPSNHTLSICMGGGGASGAYTIDQGQDIGGPGGEGGEELSTTYNASNGQNVTCVIGNGGAGAAAGVIHFNASGGDTKFATLTAIRGSGGYFGSSQNRSTCGGTYHAGWEANSTTGPYGGQAGVHGHGGNAYNGVGTTNGGGGGGGGNPTSGCGAGSKGKIVITWSAQ